MTMFSSQWFASSGPTVTISFTASSTTDSDATNYAGSFDGISIGTADSARRVFVSINGPRKTGGDRTVSSVSIGGVSAALTVRQTSPNGDAHEVWSAVVTSGTTADIDIEFSATMDACAIGVWSVYDGDSSFTTATDTGTSLSQTVTVPSGGVVLAAGRSINNTTATWSAGLTENFDTQFNPAGGTDSGATSSTLSGSSTVACTFASTHSDDTMLVVAVGSA